MEFNLTELESLFRGISAIINNLEKQYQFQNTTKIYLSNGDVLKYRITRGSLSHLLGIDTNYLASTGVFNETNSYNLLKIMSENPFKINQLKSKGIIDYNKLFSKNLIEKLSGFWTNVKISPMQTEVVCKYDSSRSYKSCITNEKCNYAIIKNIYGKYFMIWLVKNNDGYYVPMSNRAFDCYDDLEVQLKELLTNQEITFITRSDNGYDKVFTLDEKSRHKKATILQDYKEKFNASSDTLHDYIYLLSNTINHKEGAKENYGVTNDIVDSIRSGSIIDLSTVTDRNLSYIVEAFNDYICLSQSDSNPKVGETYSSMKKELERVREELIRASKIIEEQNSQITSLSSENERLTEENAELSYVRNKVFELVKPKEKQMN